MPRRMGTDCVFPSCGDGQCSNSRRESRVVKGYGLGDQPSLRPVLTRLDLARASSRIHRNDLDGREILL